MSTRRNVGLTSCVKLGAKDFKALGFRSRLLPLPDLAAWWEQQTSFTPQSTNITHMLLFRTHFHTSSSWAQRPDHTLYNTVDWSRVDAGTYAVVDPMDSHAILYLSEREYHIQVRVSLSQDSKLVVLARPGDKPVTPSSDSKHNANDPSQNSPISDFSKTNSRLWRKFLSWHLSNLIGLSGKRKVKGPEAKASVELSAAVLRTLIPYWGLDLHYRLGGDLQPPRALIRALRELADRLVLILDTQGPQNLILKLKNALFVLNKYVAETPVSDPWLLGTPVSLSRAGIPRIIPLLLRRQIADKNSGKNRVLAIRLVNSILNGFRAMEGTHEPADFASIVGPHPEMDPDTLSEFTVFCKEVFWPKVVKSFATEKQWSYVKDAEKNFCIKEHDPVYIPLHAGPNVSPGLLGAQIDALAWQESRGRNYPLDWCAHVGDTRTPEVFRQCLKETSLDWYNEYSTDPYDNTPHLKLGKVQTLAEPAGKLRVIAIVDYWTQRLMAPVHEWMMKVLSFIPTDGTFNQEEATASLAGRHALLGGNAYSIDLKSATDLIPIALYRAVFGGIWRQDTVSLWIDFLTDRWFHVPKDKLVIPELRQCSIRYGRGQPMGTLSSWPSMALVHHALQLFAAQKAGRDPVFYTDYRILGDDNVTLGDDVAASYVATASALCVPTSPQKTVDGALFIFAQQIYLRGVNLSPLSLREELGVVSLHQRLEMALRAVRRGWLDGAKTVPRFLRLLLSKFDYIKSMRQWSVGQLGRLAQSALISAFGIASSQVRNLLGLQGSGMRPFSLALANKVEALAKEVTGAAGDPSRSGAFIPAKAGKKDLSLHMLERAFAVRVGGEILRRLRGQLESLQVNSIRFRMWHETVEQSGFMPIQTLVPPITTPKGVAIPELPGIAVAPSPTFTKEEIVRRLKAGLIPGFLPDTGAYPIEVKRVIRGAHGDDYDHLFSETNRIAHSGLWPVVYDSYKSLLGSIASDLPSVDYSDVEAEEEEYGGCGMTYTAEPGTTATPAGWSTQTPGIITKVEQAASAAKRLVESLVKDDYLPAPWLVLEELAEVLIKVERIPRFCSLNDFKAEVVRDSDELLKFTRHAKLITDVWRHLPFGTDFTVPTMQDELPVRSTAPSPKSKAPSDRKGLARWHEALEQARLDWLDGLTRELTLTTCESIPKTTRVVPGFPTTSLIENNVG